MHSRNLLSSDVLVFIDANNYMSDVVKSFIYGKFIQNLEFCLREIMSLTFIDTEYSSFSQVAQQNHKLLKMSH